MECGEWALAFLLVTRLPFSCWGNTKPINRSVTIETPRSTFQFHHFTKVIGLIFFFSYTLDGENAWHVCSVLYIVQIYVLRFKIWDGTHKSGHFSQWEIPVFLSIQALVTHWDTSRIQSKKLFYQWSFPLIPVSGLHSQIYFPLLVNFSHSLSRLSRHRSCPYLAEFWGYFLLICTTCDCPSSCFISSTNPISVVEIGFK